MISSLLHIHKLPLWLVVFSEWSKLLLADEQDYKAWKYKYGMTPRLHKTNKECKKVFHISKNKWNERNSL